MTLILIWAVLNVGPMTFRSGRTTRNIELEFIFSLDLNLCQTDLKRSVTKVIFFISGHRTEGEDKRLQQTLFLFIILNIKSSNLFTHDYGTFWSIT